MEPQLLFTKQNHTPVVNLRVGTTPRRIDVNTGEWRDLPSSFFTVNCWRRLAYSVSASLHKGDPVIIRGRLKSRTWNDNGRVRTAVDIEAESVGHDMSYGWSHYMKGLHPSTEEMLAKMGMTETPYGLDGTASGDISVDGGVPAGDGASYGGASYGSASYGGASYGGASYGGASYGGTGSFGSGSAFTDRNSFDDGDRYAGQSGFAAAESAGATAHAEVIEPVEAVEPTRLNGPDEHVEAAHIEAHMGAAQSETEDSAGGPDGELAAEGVPF